MRTSLIAVAVLAGASSARADDYYLTIFTAESTPFRSEKAHTFVAVTRIAPDGVAESHSISWLAATTFVRGVALRPEEGRNFTLAETFAVAHRDCLRVSVWGPYRICPELFCLIRDQAVLLDSGAVKYKGTDTLFPSRRAANCYHAIWTVSHPLRKYAGPFTCGDTTGGKTVHLFREWILCPEQTHDEILRVLGVDHEALVRRPHDYWPGRVAAVRSAIGR